VNIKQYVASVVGLLILVRGRRIRDERGLSQSAEGAILMGAAVAVALIIAVFLKTYVESHLPR
jgi:protein-S-isoprenylcysteine O-methyltransferase Ste14